MAILFLEVSEQFHFEIIPRREVDVASFASERMMPETIPIESCHTEPSSRRDYCLVSFGIFSTFAQSNEILRFKGVDSVAPKVSFIQIGQSSSMQRAGKLPRPAQDPRPR